MSAMQWKTLSVEALRPAAYNPRKKLKPGDKEYEKIIANTYSYASQIITIKTPNNERAMDAYELAKEVNKYHPNVTMADSIEEAVEMAYLMADKDSVILAFGSLSYLGRLTAIVEGK